MILRRELNQIRITVWTESGNAAVRDGINKYFNDSDVNSMQFYHHSNGNNNLPTARKESASQGTPFISYNINEALALQSSKGANIMPNDLASVRWDDLQRESVKSHITGCIQYQPQIHKHIVHLSYSSTNNNDN